MKEFGDMMLRSFWMKISNLANRTACFFADSANRLSISSPVEKARRLGVRIGDHCRLVGNVNFGSEPYLIRLGNHVSITSSQFVTHDGGVWVFREKYPKIDLVAPISVGSNVFIGAGCIILPGAVIGDDVIIGAGSVVTKELPSGFVYAGVPARAIKSISEYWETIRLRVIETKHLLPEQKRAFLKSYFSDQSSDFKKLKSES